MSSTSVSRSSETIQEYCLKWQNIENDQEKISKNLESVQAILSNNIYQTIALIDNIAFSNINERFFKGDELLFENYIILSESTAESQLLESIQPNSSILLDLKSEQPAGAMLLAASFILSKRNTLNFKNIIIYSTEFSQISDLIIQELQPQIILRLTHQTPYYPLQTEKYEQDLNKMIEEIDHLERKMKARSQFDRFVAVVFARDSTHAKKLARELQSSPQISSKMKVKLIAKKYNSRYSEDNIQLSKESSQKPLEEFSSSLDNQTNEFKSFIYIGCSVDQFNEPIYSKDISENCFCVCDFSYGNAVIFEPETECWVESSFIISKSQAALRRSCLSTRYPGTILRAAKRSSFVTSQTNDIQQAFHQAAIYYKRQSERFNLTKHVVPERLIESLQLKKQLDLKEQTKLDYKVSFPLPINKYCLDSLPKDQTFLRSIISIAQGLINKDAFEKQHSSSFTLIRSHIWSKNGLIPTLVQFRQSVSSSQDSYAQEIICSKSFLNPMFSQIAQPQQNISLDHTLQEYYQAFPQSLFYFSGNKKTGYIQVSSGLSFQVVAFSPLKVFAEYPPVILVHYMIRQGDQLFILDSSAINKEQLPMEIQQQITKNISFQISELKTFTDVSSLLIDLMWVNSGDLINSFSDEYNCIVKMNLDGDSIILQEIVSSEGEKYTSQQKLEAFESILATSKSSLANENIEFDYFNNVKLSLKKGGAIQRIVRQSQYQTFQIDNVPSRMGIEKLREWINEYSEVISVKPLECVSSSDIQDIQCDQSNNHNNSSSRGLSYIVQVDNHNDVNFFIEVFDQTELDGNIISIRSISNNLKAKLTAGGASLTEDSMGVRLKWYNLKCIGPAILEYADEVQCNEVWQRLTAASRKGFKRIDEKTIEYKYSQKGQYNLQSEEEWINFMRSNILDVKPASVIVQREKKPDILRQESLIKSIIKTHVTQQFQLGNISSNTATSKKSAIIYYHSEQDIQKTLRTYNMQCNKIGVSFTFVSPFYYYTHQIQSSLRDIFKRALKMDRMFTSMIASGKCKMTFANRENELGQIVEVIKLKAREAGIFMALRNRMIDYLEGKQLVIQKSKYSIGRLNSMEGRKLCEQLGVDFGCVIRYDGQLTSEGDYVIRVFGLSPDKEVKNEIKEEVKEKEDDEEEEIPTSKTTKKTEGNTLKTKQISNDNGQLSQIQDLIEKMLGQMIDIQIPLEENLFKVASKLLMLNELQERFALESLVLNRPKRCIEAKGSDRNVNIFKEAFGLLVEKLESSVNQESNKDLSLLTETLNKPNSAIIECEICLMEIDQPYRLQDCSHKFCASCMNLYLMECLKDFQQIPLRCPKCTLEIIVQDLVGLLDEAQWKKLVSLSLSKYVTENRKTQSFCFSPNCLYIFDPTSHSYKCPLCKIHFCVACKIPVHPGVTCQEAQEGLDLVTKQYFAEIDARRCPNNWCGAMISRIDGCNKVQCKSCNKCICWHKICMKVFDTPEKCYEHLQKEHGGYF